MKAEQLTLHRAVRADMDDLEGEAINLAGQLREDGSAKGFLRFESLPLPALGRSWIIRGVRVLLETPESMRADTLAFDNWEDS